MSNAVELKGVTKQFSDFTLGPIDLALPTGCIMGFIGENGAGKTTTLKLMLGLIKSDAGELSVLSSHDLVCDRRLKEHVGVVMDESSFPENLTLTNINAVLRRCYQTWDDTRFRTFCARFRLPQKKPVKTFSRGMKMKLSIAAALSHDSRLLLLDEPTSGLDPIVRDEMLDVFWDFIQDEQHSILLSSHITSDLEKICDYITFIHQGRIILSRPKDELLESYVLARGSVEAIDALSPAAVVGVRRSAYGAEALVHREMLPANMAYEPATLESIMLYHVKEAH